MGKPAALREVQLALETQSSTDHRFVGDCSAIIRSITITVGEIRVELHPTFTNGSIVLIILRGVDVTEV